MPKKTESSKHTPTQIAMRRFCLRVLYDNPSATLTDLSNYYAYAVKNKSFDPYFQEHVIETITDPTLIKAAMQDILQEYEVTCQKGELDKKQWKDKLDQVNNEGLSNVTMNRGYYLALLKDFDNGSLFTQRKSTFEEEFNSLSEDAGLSNSTANDQSEDRELSLPSVDDQRTRAYTDAQEGFFSALNYVTSGQIVTDAQAGISTLTNANTGQNTTSEKSAPPSKASPVSPFLGAAIYNHSPEAPQPLPPDVERFFPPKRIKDALFGARSAPADERYFQLCVSAMKDYSALAKDGNPKLGELKQKHDNLLNKLNNPGFSRLPVDLQQAIVDICRDLESQYNDKLPSSTPPTSASTQSDSTPKFVDIEQRYLQNRQSQEVTLLGLTSPENTFRHQALTRLVLDAASLGLDRKKLFEEVQKAYQEQQLDRYDDSAYPLTPTILDAEIQVIHDQLYTLNEHGTEEESKDFNTISDATPSIPVQKMNQTKGLADVGDKNYEILRRVLADIQKDTKDPDNATVDKIIKEQKTTDQDVRTLCDIVQKKWSEKSLPTQEYFNFPNPLDAVRQNFSNPLDAARLYGEITSILTTQTGSIKTLHKKDSLEHYLAASDLKESINKVEEAVVQSTLDKDTQKMLTQQIAEAKTLGPETSKADIEKATKKFSSLLAGVKTYQACQQELLVHPAPDDTQTTLDDAVTTSNTLQAAAEALQEALQSSKSDAEKLDTLVTTSQFRLLLSKTLYTVREVNHTDSYPLATQTQAAIDAFMSMRVKKSPSVEQLAGLQKAYDELVKAKDSTFQEGSQFMRDRERRLAFEKLCRSGGVDQEEDLKPEQKLFNRLLVLSLLRKMEASFMASPLGIRSQVLGGSDTHVEDEVLKTLSAQGNNEIQEVAEALKNNMASQGIETEGINTSTAKNVLNTLNTGYQKMVEGYEPGLLNDNPMHLRHLEDLQTNLVGDIRRLPGLPKNSPRDEKFLQVLTHDLNHLLGNLPGDLPSRKNAEVFGQTPTPEQFKDLVQYVEQQQQQNNWDNLTDEQKEHVEKINLTIIQLDNYSVNTTTPQSSLADQIRYYDFSGDFAEAMSLSNGLSEEQDGVKLKIEPERKAFIEKINQLLSFDSYPGLDPNQKLAIISMMLDDATLQTRARYPDTTPDEVVAPLTLQTPDPALPESFRRLDTCLKSIGKDCRLAEIYDEVQDKPDSVQDEAFKEAEKNPLVTELFGFIREVGKAIAPPPPTTEDAAEDAAAVQPAAPALSPSAAQDFTQYYANQIEDQNLRLRVQSNLATVQPDITQKDFQAFLNQTFSTPGDDVDAKKRFLANAVIIKFLYAAAAHADLPPSPSHIAKHNLEALIEHKEQLFAFLQARGIFGDNDRAMLDTALEDFRVHFPTEPITIITLRNFPFNMRQEVQGLDKDIHKIVDNKLDADLSKQLGDILDPRDAQAVYETVILPADSPQKIIEQQDTLDLKNTIAEVRSKQNNLKEMKAREIKKQRAEQSAYKIFLDVIPSLHAPTDTTKQEAYSNLYQGISKAEKTIPDGLISPDNLLEENAALMELFNNHPPAKLIAFITTQSTVKTWRFATPTTTIRPPAEQVCRTLRYLAIANLDLDSRTQLQQHLQGLLQKYETLPPSLLAQVRVELENPKYKLSLQYREELQKIIPAQAPEQEPALADINTYCTSLPDDASKQVALIFLKMVEANARKKNTFNPFVVMGAQIGYVGKDNINDLTNDFAGTYAQLQAFADSLAATGDPTLQNLMAESSGKSQVMDILANLSVRYPNDTESNPVLGIKDNPANLDNLAVARQSLISPSGSPNTSALIERCDFTVGSSIAESATRAFFDDLMNQQDPIEDAQVNKLLGEPSPLNAYFLTTLNAVKQLTDPNDRDALYQQLSNCDFDQLPPIYRDLITQTLKAKGITDTTLAVAEQGRERDAQQKAEKKLTDFIAEQPLQQRIALVGLIKSAFREAEQNTAFFNFTGAPLSVNKSDIASISKDEMRARVTDNEHVNGAGINEPTPLLSDDQLQDLKERLLAVYPEDKTQPASFLTRQFDTNRISSKWLNDQNNSLVTGIERELIELNKNDPDKATEYNHALNSAKRDTVVAEASAVMVAPQAVKITAITNETAAIIMRDPNAAEAVKIMEDAGIDDPGDIAAIQKACNEASKNQEESYKKLKGIDPRDKDSPTPPDFTDICANPDILSNYQPVSDNPEIVKEFNEKKTEILQQLQTIPDVLQQAITTSTNKQRQEENALQLEAFESSLDQRIFEIQQTEGVDPRPDTRNLKTQTGDLARYYTAQFFGSDIANGIFGTIEAPDPDPTVQDPETTKFYSDSDQPNLTIPEKEKRRAAICMIFDAVYRTNNLAGIPVAGVISPTTFSDVLQNPKLRNALRSIGFDIDQTNSQNEIRRLVTACQDTLPGTTLAGVSSLTQLLRDSITDTTLRSTLYQEYIAPVEPIAIQEVNKANTLLFTLDKYAVGTDENRKNKTIDLVQKTKLVQAMLHQLNENNDLKNRGFPFIALPAHINSPSDPGILPFKDFMEIVKDADIDETVFNAIRDEFLGALPLQRFKTDEDGVFETAPNWLGFSITDFESLKTEADTKAYANNPTSIPTCKTAEEIAVFIKGLDPSTQQQVLQLLTQAENNPLTFGEISNAADAVIKKQKPDNRNATNEAAQILVNVAKKEPSGSVSFFKGNPPLITSKNVLDACNNKGITVNPTRDELINTALQAAMPTTEAEKIALSAAIQAMSQNNPDSINKIIAEPKMQNAYQQLSADLKSYRYDPVTVEELAEKVSSKLEPDQNLTSAKSPSQSSLVSSTVSSLSESSASVSASQQLGQSVESSSKISRGSSVSPLTPSKTSHLPSSSSPRPSSNVPPYSKEISSAPSQSSPVSFTATTHEPSQSTSGVVVDRDAMISDAFSQYVQSISPDEKTALVRIIDDSNKDDGEVSEENLVKIQGIIKKNAILSALRDKLMDSNNSLNANDFMMQMPVAITAQAQAISTPPAPSGSPSSSSSTELDSKPTYEKATAIAEDSPLIDLTAATLPNNLFAAAVKGTTNPIFYTLQEQIQGKDTKLDEDLADKLPLVLKLIEENAITTVQDNKNYLKGIVLESQSQNASDAKFLDSYEAGKTLAAMMHSHIANDKKLTFTICGEEKEIEQKINGIKDYAQEHGLSLGNCRLQNGEKQQFDTSPGVDIKHMAHMAAKVKGPNGQPSKYQP